ncbi:MAG TPA: sigma-70 family RNA polymerase sigma factor [Marmoricola sp.]|jgi:DNA-directed RNA polymerase specialized sigma24 family protein|nr:sigma-70 family RNA polymerase sigma factor [Marmoricola sp.]
MTTAKTDDAAPPCSSATDRDCIDQVQAGDLRGFGPLIDRHHSQVHAAATTLAGRHLAVELTDEAFGRLLVLLQDGGRPGTSVRYFLYRSLRERYRQHQKQAAHGGRPRVPSIASPIPFDAPGHQDSQMLAAAYRNLPDDWRQVLWLRTLEGLGDREIAEALGLERAESRRLCHTADAVLRIAYIAAHLRLDADRSHGDADPSRGTGGGGGGVAYEGGSDPRRDGAREP